MRPVASQATDGWRVFEITTRVEVLRPAGRTRVWLPTPLAVAPYQKTLGDTYRAEGGVVEMVERPDLALDMVVAEWPDGVTPRLELTSRVATTEHRVATNDGDRDVERVRGVYESIVRDRSAQDDPNAIFVDLLNVMGVRARNVYGLDLSSPDATRSPADPCRGRAGRRRLGAR